MPKELINGAPLPVTTSEPAGEGGPGRPVVEVKWFRDHEFVTLATKCVDREDGGRLVAEGHPFIVTGNAETTFSTETIHYTDGFWVDLDRRGVNELIRKLKRARDQAFGKDE